MFIDPHVHLRDFNQKEKETVKHGLEVARNSGVVALFDMPNTSPPIMTRVLVLDRLRIAKDADVREVFYGMHMGLTADVEQVKRAVEIYREFSQVIGMKLYAGHSVGDLGVTELEDQRRVYETLTKEGYEGILAVHCEKEDLIHRNLFNPLNAITHCHAQPEEAEVESVKDQLELVYKTGFKGKLHIAHISSPRAVKLVNDAKERGLDISSGICPHHFIYDWGKMRCEDGILYKMNPPLRSPESKEKMFDLLRKGKIDWIETDHAPHTLNEKVKEPFMSGIPGIASWPVFREYLRHHEFSDYEIERLTFSNAVKRFGIDIPRKKPGTLVNCVDDYPFNPYESMEKKIGWKGVNK